MTRVLVLGGGGMLGHKAFQVLSGEFDTWVTFRRFDEKLRKTGLFPADRVIDGVDASDLATVQRAVDRVAPDVVINCIGIIKQLAEAKNARISIRINALLPHELADICRARGARLIHISTDCVFSGRKGGYTDDDPSDAEDLYGRSKFLGEVATEGALTLRTSIIGRELFTDVSLVDWFLGRHDEAVRGFTNAIFSGFTSIALSREIARVIRDYPSLSGRYNVSAEPMDKYHLLLLLREAYGTSVEIEPHADFRCDRSLDSRRYRAATGFVPPSWPEMIREMAEDSTPYERIKGLAAAV